MAPLTFADTHNMVAYLSKSNASEGFDQIMDFLNAYTIQYALVVNPTIYVSFIKQFWATAKVNKVNDVVQLRVLIDGKNMVVFKYIIRRDLHLDDADGVECLLNEEIFEELARMGYEKPPPKLTFYKAFFFTQWKFLIHTLVQCLSAKRTAWNEFSCSIASTIIGLATELEKVFQELRLLCFASMLVQPQPQAEEEEEEVEVLNASAPPSPTNSLSPNLQDPTPTPYATPHASPPQEQPRGCIQTKEKIEAIDADEDITLVDMEKDKEVKMTMAKTLIKQKAEKAKLLNEQIAQKLHDEKVQKAVAKDKQEKDDMERAQNMAGYKMEHFRGMTYDKVRPVFEREYKKVQTLFKPDKDVEEPKKKRVDDETLLQESFKKPRVVEVSGSKSTQEIPSNGLKEMSKEDEIHTEGSRTYWKIIRVGGITEAYQSFKGMLKGFDKEDMVALWSLVKEKFSSAFPNVDKVHQVSSTTRRHDMFMLTEKDYPLSNGVMILMLSRKLQVEEDNEMVIDLVMKIFMEANKPKSKSLDTSSK
uniref:Synaptobrevin, longin-like domain protein n=1 Tax=Tanacetum cinerariifolium TaxID=118510 RepID=A0A699H7X7_TANCI|nr:hypothetical protein [Tanacetum cinerariifolium]